MTKAKGMDSETWERLKHVQPNMNTAERWRIGPQPASLRRSERENRKLHPRHQRVGPAREPVGIARARRHGEFGERRTWNGSPTKATMQSTKQRPWTRKRNRRVRNRMARQSRKANR